MTAYLLELFGKVAIAALGSTKPPVHHPRPSNSKMTELLVQRRYRFSATCVTFTHIVTLRMTHHTKNRQIP